MAEMAEYPFLTLTKFSPNFLLHLGGMVSAKSVKVSILLFDSPPPPPPQLEVCLSFTYV